MTDIYVLILYILLLVIVIPLIIFVNKKLYWNIKNEEHLEKGKVIQYLIKTYALVQCIAWPCIVILWGLIRLIGIYSQNSPFSGIVSTLRFLSILLRDYLQFHSLVVATLRYIFIVYDSEATKFGIQRIRAFFISASFAVPFLATFLYELTYPIEKTYVHWFYGQESVLYQYNNSEQRQNDRITNERESVFFCDL